MTSYPNNAMESNMDKQITGEQLIRLPKVMVKTGSARATIYKRIAEGTFPKQVNLGPRSVAWIESEVDAWIQKCINSSRKA